MKFWSAIIILFTTHCLLGQEDTLHILPDPNAAPRERFADFIHAQIQLDFVPDSGKVIGSVIHTFKPLRPTLDSLYLDAPKMVISSATLNDKAVKFKKNDEGVTFLFDKPIVWKEEYKLKIDYTAYPRRGMYFIGWDDPTGRSRKVIWTQGQGIDNRHWVPLFDDQADKITTDILLTFSSEYEVLSNGELINRMGGQEKATWHYQMSRPHSPYLMMVGIGKYNIHREQSSSGIALNNYIYTDWDDRYKWTYTYSKQIFDFLENEIGMPYPWGKTYSQIPVPDYLYGAMENTTATVFGDFYCVDSIGFNDKNYVYVNGHELAHQWFGDLVTGRSGAHHWLHESFATYYHHLTVKKFFGDDEFQKMMRDNRNAAIAEDQNNLMGIGHSRAGSSRHYLKGSVVLKMLRYVCGDTLFRVGLQHYLQQNAYKNATGADLLASFHESTGLSLDWFWNQWVYRGGSPQYSVDFSENKKEKKLEFVVTQHQDTNEMLGLFKMPIWFEVHYQSGKVARQMAWIDQKKDTITFDWNKKEKVEFVLFDPNSEVLSEVNFIKPLDFLLAQATKAPNMMDRYDAIYALRPYPMSKKQKALEQAFAKDSFYLIRGEVLIQMNQPTQLEDYPEKLMRQALQSNDVKLQQYALMVNDSIPLALKPEFEKMLSAQSYVVIRIALHRLVENFPNETDNYLEQTKNIQGSDGLNVRMKWLEIA
ncbi:MAG: M1 family metallopeptidase, partial [Flavobacteriales bacterium]|nr:M1 family metallopeptidase [Flavobacteriales bacterium]